MVDIPPDVRRGLFQGFLKRGLVLRVERYPLPGKSKDKYIVVLNQSFDREGKIHHVLTTSQVNDVPFREFSLLVPQGSYSFFSKETAIVCREVHELYYVEFEDRYADGTIEFVGELRANELAAMDTILRGSCYIPPSVRRHVVTEA